MIERGNIDLNNRPVLQNVPGERPGSHSSEISFSRADDPKHPGKEVLVPRIVNGKALTQEKAWQHYIKTGEHMGIFDNVKDANAYAEKVHNRPVMKGSQPLFVVH